MSEANEAAVKATKKQKFYLDAEDAELMKGKRVLIVDDVICTGESIKALEALVAQIEGSVAAKVAVLAEGDAAKRDDIIYLEPLPVFHQENEQYIKGSRRA